MARILVVDPEPLLLGTLVRVLGRRFELVVEESPKRALARDDLSSFDLFIVDVAMAELPGIAFFARVLQRDPTRRDRVIFMSSLGTPATSGHLAKPFSIHELFRIVDRKLRENGAVEVPAYREPATVRVRPLRRPANTNDDVSFAWRASHPRSS